MINARIQMQIREPVWKPRREEIGVEVRRGTWGIWDTVADQIGGPREQVFQELKDD